MPYDPNDPNQDSQAPQDQSDPTSQATNRSTSGTINARLRQNPSIARWLTGHNNGHNLLDYEKEELLRVVRSTGMDTTQLEVADDGTIQPNTGHTWREIALGSVMAFGPVAAAWAAPYIGAALAGSSPAAVPSAAGAAPVGGVEAGVVSGLGSGVLPGAGTALPKLAGLTPSVGLGSDLLRYGLPVAGNLIGGIIQANAAGNASDAQQKYLEEALAYEKSRDALAQSNYEGNVNREASRYATYSNNIAPYLANGTMAGGRMTSLLGLGSSPARAGAANASPAFSDEDAAWVDAQFIHPENSSQDRGYWKQRIAENGGLKSPQYGPDYWAKRMGSSDAAYNASLSGGPALTAPPAAAPSTPKAYGTQPLARDNSQPMVLLQAPDGSKKSVPASEVDHWKAKGAVEVGVAA